MREFKKSRGYVEPFEGLGDCEFYNEVAKTMGLLNTLACEDPESYYRIVETIRFLINQTSFGQFMSKRK